MKSILVEDFQDRFLPSYKGEWVIAYRHPMRILSASVYMFFASGLPGIALGEFLSQSTNQTLGISHVLASTGLCGVIYSLISGQARCCCCCI
jgi:hypothetical protein